MIIKILLYLLYWNCKMLVEICSGAVTIPWVWVKALEAELCVCYHCQIDFSAMPKLVITREEACMLAK